MKEKENEAIEKQIFENKSYLNDNEMFNSNKLEFESQSDNIENGNFNSIYKKDHSRNKNEDKILYSEKIRCKRILIEFSLIIVLISFICLFGYFFILQGSLIDLELILQTKTPHFHCNFILLYSIWILVGSKLLIYIEYFNCFIFYLKIFYYHFK